MQTYVAASPRVRVITSTHYNWDAPKTISVHHELYSRLSAEQHYDGREEFLQTQRARQGKRVCDSLKFSRVFVCFRTARVTELGKVVCLDFCTQRGERCIATCISESRASSVRCLLQTAGSGHAVESFPKAADGLRLCSDLLAGKQCYLLLGLGPTQHI